MATVHVFQDECPAITAGGVAENDMMLVWDTSAQITKSCTPRDMATAGTGAVNTTATVVAITAAAHAGKTVTLSTAAAFVVTLPQATGTGNKYRFQFQVAATGTTSSITVANATDIMQGMVCVATTSSNNVIAYIATATDDTMKFNGTTMGGVKGDWYEVTDVKTGFFQVIGFSAATGTTVTPFLANV